MAINYTSFRAALIQWGRSLGLPASQVLFADQTIPQPELRPYITFKITIDEAQFFDEIRNDFILNERYSTGVHTIHVSVQVIGSTQEQGQNLHMLTASKLQKSLSHISTQNLFDSANAACFDHGQILDATQYLETEFEPKAVLDVRFYVGGVDVESLDSQTTGTFIDRVRSTGVVEDLNAIVTDVSSPP